VDFHQDAFSRFATNGCGDGFPGWAISASARRQTPDNAAGCASWGIQMLLDPQTPLSWNDFYAGVNGVRASYLMLLDAVATRLHDKPAVLGYDMLNEPGGDEATQIAPLYQDAARTLRARDPDAVLFVSPGTITSAGTATALPRPSFDNFVYSPHYYDAGVSQLQSWLGTSLADPVRQMVDQANTWNVPLIVGEFGAPADGLRSDAYIDEFYKQLDANLVSGAQWNYTPHWTPQKKDGWNTEDFSIVNDAGRLRANYRVHPYPARIAGNPVTFYAGNSVELVWQHDPAAGETLLFAPVASLFGGRLSIQAGDAKCSYDENLRYLRCTSDGAGTKRVRLLPCAPGAGCVGAR
jgi:endoglycosylceramidase